MRQLCVRALRAKGQAHTAHSVSRMSYTASATQLRPQQGEVDPRRVHARAHCRLQDCACCQQVCLRPRLAHQLQPDRQPCPHTQPGSQHKEPWCVSTNNELENACRPTAVSQCRHLGQSALQQHQQLHARGERSHGCGLSSAACACAAAGESQACDELSLWPRTRGAPAPLVPGRALGGAGAHPGGSRSAPWEEPGCSRGAAWGEPGRTLGGVADRHGHRGQAAEVDGDREAHQVARLAQVQLPCGRHAGPARACGLGLGGVRSPPPVVQAAMMQAASTQRGSRTPARAACTKLPERRAPGGQRAPSSGAAPAGTGRLPGSSQVAWDSQEGEHTAQHAACDVTRWRA